MNQVTRLAIFGTGQGSVQTMELLDPGKTEIVGFLDSNREKQGRLFFGRPVFPPEAAADMDVDFYLIGSLSYAQEMKQTLHKFHVPHDKIFCLLRGRSSSVKSFHRVNRALFQQNNMAIRTVKEEYLSQYFNNYAVCQMRLDFETRTKAFYLYEDYLLKGIDYVRLSTIELLAREIDDRNVEGAIGELGVYQGHLTKMLHALFPGRHFYLFDTFEGFRQEDIQMEQEKGYSGAESGHFSDTNVELVLEKLGRPDNVHIIKGYFPASTRQTEDRKYAFVSIDADLYQPTYEGLKYFYRLLSPGGYILVHDFNFEKYMGVKEAVRTFCAEAGIGYVPVSDYFGSVLIAK